MPDNQSKTERPAAVSSTPLVRLSLFQLELLKDMETNIWYDCYQNQGTGGAGLPDWFYRQQTQPMASLRPMLECGAIRGRKVHGWPQVCKPNEKLTDGEQPPVMPKLKPN